MLQAGKLITQLSGRSGFRLRQAGTAPQHLIILYLLKSFARLFFPYGPCYFLLQIPRVTLTQHLPLHSMLYIFVICLLTLDAHPGSGPELGTYRDSGLDNRETDNKAVKDRYPGTRQLPTGFNTV